MGVCVPSGIQEQVRTKTRAQVLFLGAGRAAGGGGSRHQDV